MKNKTGAFMKVSFDTSLWWWGWDRFSSSLHLGWLHVWFGFNYLPPVSIVEKLLNDTSKDIESGETIYLNQGDEVKTFH